MEGLELGIEISGEEAGVAPIDRRRAGFGVEIGLGGLHKLAEKIVVNIGNLERIGSGIGDEAAKDVDGGFLVTAGAIIVFDKAVDAVVVILEVKNLVGEGAEELTVGAGLTLGDDLVELFGGLREIGGILSVVIFKHSGEERVGKG